jgi:hypothetical protein
MNSTPQVETVEISDAELDNVSGGLSVNALDNVTGLVDGIVPVSGLLDSTLGALPVNTQGLTNTVSAL